MTPNKNDKNDENDKNDKEGKVALPPFYRLFVEEIVKKVYDKYPIRRDSDDNRTGKYMIPHLSPNLTSDEKHAEVARLSPQIKQLNELRHCYDENGKLKTEQYV